MDLLTQMVTAVDEKEVLTDDEVVAYPILLHVTGHRNNSGAAELA